MVVLHAGPNVVDIDLARGGRLSSMRVHGLELLEQPNPSNEPFGWGSFPMIPWAGRIRNGEFGFDSVTHHMPVNMGPHAIHGTTFDTSWTHLSGGPDWAMLGLRFESPWPFPGSATQLIHLGGDTLTQTITVVAGDTAMPAVVGWHPWFRRTLDRGQALSLDVDTANASLLVRDSAFIPTGKRVRVSPRPWDDCFEGLGRIALEWQGALTLQIEHDCEYVVIYDPSHAICVEPQSGMPDAFNVEPENCRLEPGEVLERTVTWRWAMASRQQ
jgi:aldose 1-epimerase